MKKITYWTSCQWCLCIVLQRYLLEVSTDKTEAGLVMNDLIPLLFSVWTHRSIAVSGVLTSAVNHLCNSQRLCSVLARTLVPIPMPLQGSIPCFASLPLGRPELLCLWCELPCSSELVSLKRTTISNADAPICLQHWANLLTAARVSTQKFLRWCEINRWPILTFWTLNLQSKSSEERAEYKLTSA